MLSDLFAKAFVSQAGTEQGGYVTYGYGQVEPNHLSAQRTGQIYAQLPAKSDINILENGQFVKYDYKDGVVDFTGKGEWMLVFNEIKLYRDDQSDCEFAMRKGDYFARVYSPVDGEKLVKDGQSRYYGGKDDQTQDIEKVTAGADPYEPHYNEDPFKVAVDPEIKKMPEKTTMVPRVFKTNVGDIFTTNMIKETSLSVGDELSPGTSDGILSKSGDESMTWQVVKVYTMPDGQKGVKIMRIA